MPSQEEVEVNAGMDITDPLWSSNSMQVFPDKF